MNNGSATKHSFAGRTTLLLGVLMAVIAAIGIGLYCHGSAENRCVDVLRDYRENAESWLKNTSENIELWAGQEKAQRQRISGSETYRIFATDLSHIETADTAKINSDDAAGLSPEVAALATQVPYIRKILLEFMNANGMTDVRLINKEGQTLISAVPRPAALTTDQKEAAGKVFATGSHRLLPIRAQKNELILDVLEPVFDMEAPDRPVAVLLTSQPVLGKLAQFLTRDKPDELALATILQHTEDGWIKLQLPKPVPVSEALAKTLNRDPHLAYAERSSIAQNGSTAYSTAASLPNLGLMLVYEVPADSIQRTLFRARLPIYFAGVCVWICFLLLAALAWWIAFGRQQRAVAQELGRLNTVISQQKNLLDCVNLSLDVGLIMSDVKGRIHLCNRAFGDLFGKSEKELTGASVFETLPPDNAAELLNHIRQTASDRHSGGYEMRLTINGSERLIRVTLLPFIDDSAERVRDGLNGAVVTMKDITEFRRLSMEKEHRTRALISALVRVEESVDPHLHGHTARVVDLATRLAAHMNLSKDATAAVLMAAPLSQIGKLFVRRELLTKNSRLTPEELTEIRQAPNHAYDLLKDIDFGLPIPQTLVQMYENMDGTGYPNGIKGDAIIPEARILAVLNAYVSMTTTRAYRDGMSPDKAISELENRGIYDMDIVRHLRAMLANQNEPLKA